MHKRGIIRYANYTVCASVFIHFCMQRKNNENIPIIKLVISSLFVSIFFTRVTLSGREICPLLMHLSINLIFSKRTKIRAQVKDRSL